LLAACGIPFDIVPSAIDEQPLPDELAEAYVRRLAQEKAEAVAQQYPHAVVLAADTTVAIDGLLLGKPDTAAVAQGMLQRLSGRMHIVYTGVAVVADDGGRRSGCGSASEVITSQVLMRPFTASTIAWYIATGEPLDKAGAYAVQGLGAALVERVEGSYTNVVGLPLTETLSLLQRFGARLGVLRHSGPARVKFPPVG
jgi:septum formation protein